MSFGIIPSGNYGYVAATKTFTISGAAFQGLTIESILSIYNLTKKRPVYNSKDNTVNDITDFTTGASSITFKINAPYAGEFANTDKFQIIVSDNQADKSAGKINTSLAFAAGDTLTTEKLTSALQVPGFSKSGYYLLSISKPDEATAGDLTVNIYNQIKIDGTNTVDTYLTTVVVEQIAGAATNRSFEVLGLGIGQGTIKLGMKFAADSGAITVNASLHAI
jgi:hypothetical protein